MLFRERLTEGAIWTTNELCEEIGEENMGVEAMAAIEKFQRGLILDEEGRRALGNANNYMFEAKVGFHADQPTSVALRRWRRAAASAKVLQDLGERVGLREGASIEELYQKLTLLSVATESVLLGSIDREDKILTELRTFFHGVAKHYQSRVAEKQGPPC